MLFKTQMVVLGAKSSKGEYNGRHMTAQLFSSMPIYKMAITLSVKWAAKPY